MTSFYCVFYFVSCTIFNMQLTAKCIYIKMYQIQNLFWNASQQKKNPWYHLINSSIYLLFPNNNLFTRECIPSPVQTDGKHCLTGEMMDDLLFSLGQQTYSTPANLSMSQSSSIEKLSILMSLAWQSAVAQSPHFLYVSHWLCSW